MVNSSPDQLPLKFTTGRKTDIRAQFAALCWRIKDGKVQVCLVTSRTRKRWIIPKGWPMHKQTPADAAAQEAYEEAGVSGQVSNQSLGIYTYVKPLKEGTAPAVAIVYPMRVTKVHAKWPEKTQRRRKWFSPKKAAKRLEEPELKRIVARFTPPDSPPKQ